MKVNLSCVALCLLPPLAAVAQQPKPKDTEVWSPVPPVVATLPEGQPPADATVLFDGHSLESWVSSRGRACPWKLVNGALQVVPGSDDIHTKAAFADIQLHVEWRTPERVVGNGQDRGNSGVYFMELYELQIMDSYENPTYVNGQAASIYKQSPPLVNASRPPGVWQSYDVIFIAPRFDTEGKLLTRARMTAFHNGVLVQYDFKLSWPTINKGTPAYIAHPVRMPLVLQDHGAPVEYRNIWVRNLPETLARTATQKVP